MGSISGYIGVFQPPVLSLLESKHYSIYCIKSEDNRTLVIIPLVQNFFADAYMAARNSRYQEIHLVLPALDALFISDAYLLYSEVHRNLGKRMHVYCPYKPQLLVTDEFSSFVHHTTEPIIFGHWNECTDLNPHKGLQLSIEFPPDYRPLTRMASDIYIATERKRILFCVYMTEEKLEYFSSREMCNRFDEIHVPFAKNIYGGLKYFEIRKAAKSSLLPKLYAYGFQSTEELVLCNSIGGRIGEVRINDFV